MGLFGWVRTLPLILPLLLLKSNPGQAQLAQLVNPLQTVGNVLGNLQSNPQGSTNTGPNSYRDILDPDNGLALTWTVNRNAGSILFTIEANTRTGFVALALTKRGVLQGADVIVVGIRQGDGSPYVLDMHGVDNSTIAVDERQDWRLENASTLGAQSGIRISIRRNLDTCDPQDMPISEEQISVLHGVGGDDSILSSQFDPDNARKIYFFDPFILPTSSNVNPAQLQMWRLSRRYEMPPRPTSYWCTIHKLRPSLPTRHHVAGFNVYFADEVAKRHVHHQIMYRCVAPPGADAQKLFEPFLDYPGEECYVNERPILPSAYCREMVHIFAIGGEPVYFPESVGINIGGSANEYFMFEAHYDNPNRTAGVVVENGVDMYYTPQIRPNSGSLIFVGHGVLGTFVVPPNTSNFSMAGHCSKECSLQMIPLGGLDIVGASLHAHTSTRKMRFRHFRGTNELPWIINDDEYDFQYQQIRMLETPRRILPGDQLIVECGYDTNWKDGEAVASGFSTRDEMCMIFLLVNRQIPYLFCSSEYDTDRTMERFRIRNMTWDLDIQERRINAAADPSIVGLTLSQVVEGQSWSPQRTRLLEREQMYSFHQAHCPNMRLMGTAFYYGTGFQNLTGIQIPLLQMAAPTSRAMRTPFPALLPVAYPLPGQRYTPPQRTCPARAAGATADANVAGVPGIINRNGVGSWNGRQLVRTPWRHGRRLNWVG